MDIAEVAPILASMIGLGVGIDSALFIITRHRQHLAEGMTVEEAAAAPPPPPARPSCSPAAPW